MIRAILLWTALSITCYVSAQSLPKLIPFNNDGKWGYADSLGNMILPASWAEARLYDHGKAIVGNPTDSGRRRTYSLTTEKGGYIIPPSAGWNGDTMGWMSYQANVVNRFGRKGLMDTTGRLLIRYEWDGMGGYGLAENMRDSFKVVTKNGYHGVVDRRGAVIIPCRWAAITSTTSLAAIHGFIVKDPDNKEGLNAYGVVNDRNEVLLTPRYHEITLLRLPSYGLVFQVRIAVENQPARSSFVQNPAHFFQKYFAYPSGKEVFPADTITNKYRMQTLRPDGYVLFGNNQYQGLMDRNGKVVVPCCTIWMLSGDTVFTRDTKKLSDDSLRVIERKLNLYTLQQLGAPEKYIRYLPPRKPANFDRYSGRESSSPSIYLAGVNATKFFKDSFLYTTVSFSSAEKETNNRHLYIVQGYVYPDGNQQQPYYAIIDKKLNYIISPENQYRIICFNQKDDILTVSNNNKSGLIASSGKFLMPLQHQSPYLNNGFRSQGKVYGIVGILDNELAGTNRYSGAGRQSQQITITDSAGFPLKALAKLTPVAANTLDILRSGLVIVKDSSGKTGLVTLDGNTLLPEVNFKYTQLYVLNNHYYFSDTGNLINSKGEKIFKNFVFYRMHPSMQRSTSFNGAINIWNASNRLYLVTGRDKQSGKQVHFYMSDTGIPYYANP